METKTPQMLKPSTLKSILKKKKKYSKQSVFRKFMPKATQKSSRKQKVNLVVMKDVGRMITTG